MAGAGGGGAPGPAADARARRVASTAKLGRLGVECFDNGIQQSSGWGGSPENSPPNLEPFYNRGFSPPNRGF